jgi:putative hemolysin
MFELAIVLALVLLDGLFALSELAIVSARRAPLQAMTEARRPGARAALTLSEDPGRFLSTVQIGITLVGILAGTFSGAALGGRLAVVLERFGLSPGVAELLGFVLVVAVITYLSIVVGELAPKRFVLRAPEAIACLVAPGMTLLSRVATPVAWLLYASTGLVFHVLGTSERGRSFVEMPQNRTPRA